MLNQASFKLRQTGAALIISLVLLTMLTTLGVTAMRGNLLDVRIHNNTKSKLVALQCAEAALLAGENWIWTATDRIDVQAGVVPSQSALQAWPVGADELAGMKMKDASWWSANAWSYGTALSNAKNYIGCSQTPYYIVEKYDAYASVGGNQESSASYIDQIKGNSLYYYFRISAYGVGTLDTAPVVLQSTFAKPVN